MRLIFGFELDLWRPAFGLHFLQCQLATFQQFRMLLLQNLRQLFQLGVGEQARRHVDVEDIAHFGPFALHLGDDELVLLQHLDEARVAIFLALYDRSPAGDDASLLYA